MMKRLPVSALRAQLAKYQRYVSLNRQRFALTHCGEVIGYLVPAQEVQVEHCKDVSLADFRSGLTAHWESLAEDIDCIYLTYHNKRRVAFVSPRFVQSSDQD